MRKKESRPTESTSDRPRGNQLLPDLIAPRPRRRGFPDRSLRDLQRLGPSAVEAFVSFGRAA